MAELKKVFKSYKWLGVVVLACVLGVGCWAIEAQTVDKLTPSIQDSRAFLANESFTYDLDFKWGVIRGKMGEATLTNRSTPKGQYFSQILFRTKGIGDTFFKVRDTLETLYSAEKLPLRFEKRILEGGYRYHDLVTFTHLPNEKVQVRVRGGKPEEQELRVDTTLLLSAKEVEVVDMLSTLTYLRSLQPGTIEHGFLNRFVVPIGGKLIYGAYEFAGYEKVKMPDGTSKDGIKIFFDIKDDAFAQASRSVEVWVTNDEWLIPVKVITQLSIGRVECTLASYRRI